jgi:hypothetical protein
MSWLQRLRNGGLMSQYLSCAARTETTDGRPEDYPGIKPSEADQTAMQNNGFLGLQTLFVSATIFKS